MSRILGPDAFGYGTVNAVFSGWRVEVEAFSLLVWMALRSDPELRDGMTVISALRDQAAALETIYEGTVEWRTEIPAYADVFADEA